MPWRPVSSSCPKDSTPRPPSICARTTPLRRFGTPEDVAQAVIYLLEAEYVTGEVIRVDGGRHVRR